MPIVPPYIGIWLLQFFCIIFPIILYQSFFRKKFLRDKIRSGIYGTLCGMAILICMAFPVSISKDYILDFRFIPLIIGFIYGGYRVGFFLSLLIIGYRFLLGGTGFYLGGLWMTSFFMVAFYYILPRSKKWNSMWSKLYPYLLLTVSLLFFALGTQFLDDYAFTKQEIELWVWFSFISYLTLWITLYLQDTMKDMEAMEEKVVQFEKNHTINQMVFFLSQQLNSPLQAAQDLIHSVQPEPLTAQQLSSLQQIEKELHQADYLLNHFFQFIEEKRTQKATGNFTRELEEIVNFMKMYAKMHQVELVYTSTAGKDVSVRGDQEMLRVAILNIIKNAIEACKPNGRVKVFLHEMLQEVYIVVEDNGKGIPSNVLNHLGQPLPSGKENGNGLGLASTYKIAESIGGRVEIKSMPDKGTTFNLYFPKWAAKDRLAPL